jgi:hypothetical protein
LDMNVMMEECTVQTPKIYLKLGPCETYRTLPRIQFSRI